MNDLDCCMKISNFFLGKRSLNLSINKHITFVAMVKRQWRKGSYATSR